MNIIEQIKAMPDVVESVTYNMSATRQFPVKAGQSLTVEAVQTADLKALAESHERLLEAMRSYFKPHYASEDHCFVWAEKQKQGQYVLCNQCDAIFTETHIEHHYLGRCLAIKFMQEAIEQAEKLSE
jgi:hypothetical protein